MKTYRKEPRPTVTEIETELNRRKLNRSRRRSIGYDYVVGTQPEQYHNLFDQNGAAHIWNSLPDGGHDGTSIRPHFYNFARCIFKAQ